MSLKTLLALADDKLADLFNRKPHDPTKARKKALQGIDKTHAQFHATEPQKGRKWFTHKNEVVKFHPPFPIAGKSEHFVPSERFPDYLTHLRGAVEAGELDDALNEAPPTPSVRKSSGGAGWSPERRAKFAATQAAKKVKKK